METTIELTKISSKGQIVLPKDVRTRLKIKKGTLFAMKATKNVILLKKIDNPILKEDMEELESARKGWKEIEQGKFHSLSKEAFLKELATW